MAELVMTAAEIAADRDKWLQVRREGITATDAAVIMGVSPWDSPFALWHRKKGNLPEVPDSDRFRLARHLEDYVAERWVEEQGGHLDREHCGLFRDGWRLATPDWLVQDREPWMPHHNTNVLGVLECKTVASWDGWGLGLGGRCDCFCHGPEPEKFPHPHPGCACLDVPPYVRVQVLWQCDVLGVPVGHVAVLHRQSGEFRWYTIEADPLAYEPGKFRDAAQLFYESLIDDVPPPVDGAEATTAALKALHHVSEPPGLVTLKGNLWEQYQSAKLQRDSGQRWMDEVANEVRSQMGDAKYGHDVDGKAFTRTVSKVAGHWVAPHVRDVLMPARRKAGE